MTESTPAPPLPPLPSRGRTYAFLAGAVATLLAVSVGIPLAIGDRPSSSSDGSLSAGGPSSFAPGAPLDGGVAAPGSQAPGPGGLGGDVTGQPQEGGSGLATGSGGSAGSGGSVSGGGPAGNAAGSGGSTTGGSRGGGPVARTASDQGITATTLTIGAFLVDLGGASDVGATAPGYDIEDQQRFIKAFADDTNARGGIGGRQVLIKYRKVDIIDQQTMRDACTTFGQTDRVFAVIQILGVYGDPILKCAVDQKLPFIANDGAVSSYYSAARGYVITTQPSTLRTLLNMEHELNRLGEFKGKKVGVLYEDGYLEPDSKAVVNALKKRGITPVEGVTSSSDIALALRQLPVIAQDFCSKGVDYVLLLVNELYADQFHSNAERFSGCRPSYAVSDFDFQMNGDAFLDGQNPTFFNRLLAVSSGRVGEGRIGKPEPAVDAGCRKAYETQTKTKLDRNAAGSQYFNALAMCGLFSVIKQGFEAAGTNPTRASFVGAIGGLGTITNPGYGSSSFTRTRYDAPQVVRISRGFLDCKCWKPQTDFFAAKFR